MIEIFKRVKGFLMPFLVFVVLGLLAILVFFDKGTLLLWLNDQNNIILDRLFYYSTLLGNGWVLLILGVLLFLYRYRLGIMAGLAFGIQGGFIQFLKRGIFDETLRPINYFENVSDVHLIQDVAVKGYYTFPSGHSGAAFCLFTVIALLTQQTGLQFLSFMIALIAGISRIYLFQHFFIDIYVGAIIGTFVAFLMLYNVYFLVPDSLAKKEWWQHKGLLFN